MYSHAPPEQALLYLCLIEGKLPRHGLGNKNKATERATEETRKKAIEIKKYRACFLYHFYLTGEPASLKTKPWSRSEIDVLVHSEGKRQQTSESRKRGREAMEEDSGQKVLTPIV